ncbi:MAG TPA: serine/threonine-protein kinase [Ktedonobacteraceae bacterium]
MNDLIGQQFGNYRLTQLLGEGGFANVYLGEHIYLATHAAIKILRKRLSTDDLKNFQREAQMIAHLNHPNIVHVSDFGIDANDVPFLVMDYLPKGNIRNIHPRGQRVLLKSVVSYTHQIALALQHAHNARIIHRDVKPENLLLESQQKILLSDFGIAVVAHRTTSLEMQNIMGTALYMAPEQFRGYPTLASDQYSLGIMVFEWLCGECPFRGANSFEIGMKHITDPVPSLRQKVPMLSSEVERIVLTALAKEPHQRFSNVQAFAIALERACASAPNRPFPSTLPLAGSVPSLSPTQNAKPTSLLAIPPTQAAVNVPTSVNTISRTQPAVLPIPRTKRDPENLTLFFLIAYGLCGISWVALDIIMIIVSNISNPSDPMIINGVLFSSSIVLFFSWGWIMAQITGEAYAGMICCYIGIAAITIFGGPIYWGIASYQGSGDALQGVILGIIIAIPVFILSSLIGFGANFLGSLIGKRLSRD